MFRKVKRGSKKTAFDIRIWSYRDIVTTMHREQVHKLALKLSGSTSGSPAYLKAYKTALSKVEKKLSQSQKKRYRAMAQEWSEKPLPPTVQQRYVHVDVSSTLALTDFFVLVCWISTDPKP